MLIASVEDRTDAAWRLREYARENGLRIEVIHGFVHLFDEPPATPACSKRSRKHAEKRKPEPRRWRDYSLEAIRVRARVRDRSVDYVPCPLVQWSSAAAVGKQGPKYDPTDP